MMAAGAHGIQIGHSQMTPQSMPIEIGAVVASVNEGRVRLGICTALQGCYARVLGLSLIHI